MSESVEAQVQSLQLFAFVGEDELGSGIVGLKQAMVPAGCVPLVATTDGKINRPGLLAQLQDQATMYGKTIYLARFKFDGVVIKLEP